MTIIWVTPGNMNYIVHTDGGARGNPGPAAIGVVMEEVIQRDPSISSGRATQVKDIARFGKKIGITTNNVAEYTAVILALEWFIKNTSLGTGDTVQFYLDSNLVVNQLNGLFKIKNNDLRLLLYKIRILESQILGSITYIHVRREQNTRADFLVNAALDSE